MHGQLRKTLPKRIDIANVEHEIQKMEAELDCYRGKIRIFEETILEQQHILSKLQERYNEHMLEDSDC